MSTAGESPKTGEEVLLIIQIGVVAGEIWHYLDTKEKSTLSELYSALDHPNDVILMSIGWLAREGHVVLEEEGQDYKVSLRENLELKKE